MSAYFSSAFLSVFSVLAYLAPAHGSGAAAFAGLAEFVWCHGDRVASVGVCFA